MVILNRQEHDRKEKGVSHLPHVRESGFHREIFACGIRNLGKVCLWNPESWALESGIQLKESGIQNPSSTYKEWNQVPGIRSLRHGIQDSRVSRFP